MGALIGVWGSLHVSKKVFKGLIYKSKVREGKFSLPDEIRT